MSNVLSIDRWKVLYLAARWKAELPLDLQGTLPTPSENKCRRSLKLAHHSRVWAMSCPFSLHKIYLLRQEEA